MTTGPKPNLQRIADLAEVSRMTVSMALRNDPRVARATRARILTIAERVGYRPNPLVSALMTHIRSTRKVEYATTVAYLTAWPPGRLPHWREVPTFRRYFEGAQRRAEALGYRLEEWSLLEAGMTGPRLSRILWSRGIPAVLVAPHPPPSPRWHRLNLDWPRFASAAFNFTLWRPNLHRVSNHHYLTMMIILRQLRRLGYRRIGYAVEDHIDENVNNTWLAAFLAHTSKAEPEPARRVPPLIAAPATFRAAFPRWVAEHQPDAVVGLEEDVPGLLREMGLRVPADMGFASLDLHESDGACAGMDQRSEEVGVAAMDLIDGQLRRNERGVPATPMTVEVHSAWVSGATLHRRIPPGGQASTKI